MRIMVTYSENVEYTDDGQVVLKDAKVFGYLTKTHVLTAQAFDQESQQLKFGSVLRSEVFWEDRRNPSPSLEDPNDLVWLEFVAEDSEDYDDDDDDQDSDTEEGEG
jgi:hypothetical protein